MKRSWVLADGESNKGKNNKANNNAIPTSPLVSSTTNSIMPSSSSSLSAQDEYKIRETIEKMEMIKQQTEDLNPQV